MRKNIIIVVNEKRSEPSIEEEFQNDCYSYMADFAEKILNSEEQREISLLQQASNMQTAFSFVIAALFMLIPVVIDNRGNMSLEYLLLMFSSITAIPVQKRNLELKLYLMLHPPKAVVCGLY